MLFKDHTPKNPKKQDKNANPLKYPLDEIKKQSRIVNQIRGNNCKELMRISHENHARKSRDSASPRTSALRKKQINENKTYEEDDVTNTGIREFIK